MHFLACHQPLPDTDVCKQQRMNNEIRNNYQKNILKYAQFSATIELVRNLQAATMVDFVEVYYFWINSEELYD